MLTSIGDAHDEGFHGDRALKLSEKRKLFSGADVVVSRSLDAPRSIKELTIGADDGNFVTVEETQVLDGSCSIDITHDGVGSSFTIPFDDNASIENALTCIGVCLHLGRSP